MQAIQGFYENGTVKLDKKAPVRSGKIIVLFPEEEAQTKTGISDSEAMHLFRKFTGSIDRNFDFEKEKDEYLHEKYGPFS